MKFIEKIKSRRFIAWVAWTILAISNLFVAGVLPPEMISWYGAISSFYIGLLFGLLGLY